MIPGYRGQLLRVDLSTGSCQIEEIPERVLRDFIGAKGLGTYYFCKEVPNGIDPFSPQNRCYLATGPFQGTKYQTSGRFCFVSKSPLTGLYLDSYCGSSFGHAVRKAGYDLIVLQGRAERPVYVLIEDGNVGIHDAEDLWGLDTHENQDLLRARHGKDLEVLQCGPAGEKGVRYACLISDYRRAVGRGGAGALFGSKRLKAVAVRGTGEVQVHDAARVRQLNLKATGEVRKSRAESDMFYTQGTSMAVMVAQNQDRLPVMNFQKGTWKEAEKIDGGTLHESTKIQQSGCCVCSIACEGTVVVRKKDRPEYETLGMMGSNLGISDPDAIQDLNEMLNRLGLDAISTGNAIGFLLECAQHNLLVSPVQWGDIEGIKGLVRKIAAREDLGHLLSFGVRHMAKQIGKGSEKFAMHVKGLELPAWDPRGKLGGGLAYMTADIGGSHMRDSFEFQGPPTKPAIGIVEEHVKGQNMHAVKDSFVFCAFGIGTSSREDLREVYTAVTGLDLTPEREQEVGDRIYNLTRLYNVREGVTRNDDRLPDRWRYEPLPDGVAKGRTAFMSLEDEVSALSRYYELRGWDNDGKPTPERLKLLGLGEFDRTSA